MSYILTGFDRPNYGAPGCPRRKDYTEATGQHVAQKYDPSVNGTYVKAKSPIMLPACPSCGFVIKGPNVRICPSCGADVKSDNERARATLVVAKKRPSTVTAKFAKFDVVRVTKVEPNNPQAQFLLGRFGRVVPFDDKRQMYLVHCGMPELQALHAVQMELCTPAEA